MLQQHLQLLLYIQLRAVPICDLKIVLIAKASALDEALISELASTLPFDTVGVLFASVGSEEWSMCSEHRASGERNSNYGFHNEFLR